MGIINKQQNHFMGILFYVLRQYREILVLVCSQASKSSKNTRDGFGEADAAVLHLLHIQLLLPSLMESHFLLESSFLKTHTKCLEITFRNRFKCIPKLHSKSIYIFRMSPKCVIQKLFNTFGRTFCEKCKDFEK